MSKKENKPSSNRFEIEIRDRFIRILNLLPFEYTNAFLRWLIQKSQGQADPKDQPLELISEKAGSKNGNRVDIYFNYGELKTDKSPLKGICFELKKGKQPTGQIIRYSKEWDDFLIVSIAKDSNEELNNKENLLSITWDDIYHSFGSILRCDERKRLGVNGAEVKVEFSLSHSLDQIAAYKLDEFLNILLQENLVTALSNRVMVATGAQATKSTNEHDIYWYPSNWNHNFKYLVIVYKKEIQYAGEVSNRIKQSKSSKKLDKAKLDKIERIDKEFDENEELEILETKKIHKSGDSNPNAKNFDDWKGIENIGKYGKGAFTYSHRYFDNPKGFMDAFDPKK